VAEPWTVRRVIAWIQADFERRGVDSARLEADLIVAHTLGLKRIALFLDPDRPLMDSELAGIRKLVERRRGHEPMAYILGEREFYGRGFEVNAAVLIPRPDTELLVERALLVLRDESLEGQVLDLCVGSGAVALTLAAECPDRQLVATDISAAALAVARRNAERLGVSERVAFREGDLFQAVEPTARFACITVNPPYIGSDELSELAPDVRDYEPRAALDAGPDALSFYRRLAEVAPSFLLPRGGLLAEVGAGQAVAVSTLWQQAGLVDVRSHRDLNGIERVVEGRARNGTEPT
jgi:release factor glutamine methyltransferase